MLGDITSPALRDASFSAYFTLAFGVGSLWVALYGWVIATLGQSAGLPATFGLMAGAYLAASLAVIPIRTRRATAE